MRFLPCRNRSMMKTFIVIAAGITTILNAKTARATQCVSAAGMPATQQEALVSQVKQFMLLVQSGNVTVLQQRTLPSIAADFRAIASSVTTLKPLIQTASISVDNLYMFQAPPAPPGPGGVQFFCGSPTVVLTFSQLPAGHYVLAILHATGIPKPQQVSMILADSQAGQWTLAGFYVKPMIRADHDGLWYWVAARKYAAEHSNLTAFLYYQVAEELLRPVNFLVSPNLQKMQQEIEQVWPEPNPKGPIMSIRAGETTFNITSVSTSTEFGGLDLDLHYVASPAEAQSPSIRYQRVTSLMAELVREHPELREAFHGIWAHTENGNAGQYALELPMTQISAGQASAVVQ